MIGAVILAVGLLVARSVEAVVLGGGAADKDCRVAFEGVDATAGASGVVCIDGDPACDADGSADGACHFDVSLCVGVVAPDCTSVALDRIETGGKALVVPALPASDGTCGGPVPVTVGTGMASTTTLRAYLGDELREVDYLNLCCVATAGPFDAAACSVTTNPLASGCATVPSRVATKLLPRAGERVVEAEGDPAHARKPLRKAARLARKVRRIGQKIARHDDCGFALGLMASHADETLRGAADVLESP